MCVLSSPPGACVQVGVVYHVFGLTQSAQVVLQLPAPRLHHGLAQLSPSASRPLTRRSRLAQGGDPDSSRLVPMGRVAACLEMLPLRLALHNPLPSLSSCMPPFLDSKGQLQLLVTMSTPQ